MAYDKDISAIRLILAGLLIEPSSLRIPDTLKKLMFHCIILVIVFHRITKRTFPWVKVTMYFYGVLHPRDVVCLVLTVDI